MCFLCSAAYAADPASTFASEIILALSGDLTVRSSASGLPNDQLGILQLCEQTNGKAYHDVFEEVCLIDYFHKLTCNWVFWVFDYFICLDTYAITRCVCYYISRFRHNCPLLYYELCGRLSH